MPGFYTITLSPATKTMAPETSGEAPEAAAPAPDTPGVDVKTLELESHDGYKKKVTITFSITSANNPAPLVTPSSVRISLDEDEIEHVDVTITGSSGFQGTVYANATDGIMTAAADAHFTLP